VPEWGSAASEHTVDIAASGHELSFDAKFRATGPNWQQPLNFQAEPSQQFDLLAVDAFSGDAVPVHLLTQEAFAIYFRELKPDGVLAVHVSNRYLNLDRVARGAAEHIGFEALEIRSPGNDALSINSADWVVLTKNKDLIEKLRPVAAKPSDDDKPSVLWTDAHSSLFEILR